MTDKLGKLPVWVRDVKRYPPAPNGCTAQCCQAFYLSIEYSRLQDSKEREGLRDADFVFDMLIPIGRWEGTTPEGFKAEVKNGEVGKDQLVYTCRHFNRETGRCNVYENRPHLCRTHAPGPSCNYGCKIGYPLDVPVDRLRPPKLELGLKKA